jgi:hypothetical protein
MEPTESHGDQALAFDEKEGLIGQLVHCLARTLLASKLYDPKNSLRQNLTHELLDIFGQVLEIEDPVLLSFEPTQVLWEDRVVYDASDLDNSFVECLYRDGIRQLAFARGLPVTEVFRFLQIAQPRLGSGQDSDVVDAFWEANFTHIAHVSSDGFTQAAADDALNVEDVHAPIVVRFRQLLGNLVGLVKKPAVEPAEPTPPEAPPEVRSSAEATADFAPLPLDEPEIPLITIDPKVIEALENVRRDAGPEAEKLKTWKLELEEEAESDLLITLEELLFHIFDEAVEAITNFHHVLLVSKLVHQWLALGEFRAAGEIVSRLIGSLDRYPNQRETIELMILEAANHLSIKLVCGEAGSVEESSISEAVGFLNKHCRLSNEKLLEALDVTFSVSGQNVLAHVLANRTFREPDIWAEKLEEIPPLIAEQLVRLVGEKATEEHDLLLFFTCAFDHSDLEVQAAAMSSYPETCGMHLRDQILGAIQSDSIKVRLAAIARISKSEDTTAGAWLVNRIRRSGALGLEKREFKLLVDGIIALGGERYMPFFRKQFDEIGALKGGYLNRDLKALLRSSDEIAIMLTAVARHGTPVALDLVREVRQHANGRIREHGDDLWRQVMAEAAQAWSDDAVGEDETIEGQGADDAADSEEDDWINWQDESDEPERPKPLGQPANLDERAPEPTSKPMQANPKSGPDSEESLDAALLAYLQEEI